MNIGARHSALTAFREHELAAVGQRVHLPRERNIAVVLGLVLRKGRRVLAGNGRRSQGRVPSQMLPLQRRNWSCCRLNPCPDFHFVNPERNKEAE
jgi:hypothetical protein